MSIHSVARPYASADDRRAWLELGITFALYAAAVAVALATIGTWWIMLPAMVLASAMGLRIRLR